MSDEKRERGREGPAIWAARSGRLGQPALPTAGFGGRGKAAMEFAGGTPAPLRQGRRLSAAHATATGGSRPPPICFCETNPIFFEVGVGVTTNV